MSLIAFAFEALEPGQIVAPPRRYPIDEKAGKIVRSMFERPGRIRRTRFASGEGTGGFTG
jgi:hypothetical protein